MRQMPAGQWLPFEGYDKVHVCSSPAPVSQENAQDRKPTTLTSRRSPDSAYDDLEFLDFRPPLDAPGSAEPVNRDRQETQVTKRIGRTTSISSRARAARQRQSSSEAAQPLRDDIPQIRIHPTSSYLKAFVVLVALALIAALIVFYRHGKNRAPFASSSTAIQPTPAPGSSVAANSVSASNYYQQGVELTKARKYDAAVESYVQALNRDPKMAEAHHELGYAYIQLRQWDKAVASLKEAVALKPDSAESYRLLGDALVMLDQWQEAIAVYNRAVSLQPDSISAFFGLAKSYRHTDQWDKAVEAYQKIIELRPKNATAHYQLGLLYLEIGDRDKAETEYDQLLPLNSELAERLSKKISEHFPA
jgi:tetratricopeptide (TPR) repeat protein